MLIFAVIGTAFDYQGAFYIPRQGKIVLSNPCINPFAWPMGHASSLNRQIIISSYKLIGYILIRLCVQSGVSVVQRQHSKGLLGDIP
jgi:hypothetical protein